MDKTALFNLSYGMYIVSSVDDGRNVGCVANSIIQVSSEPATLAVSINKDNYTNPCILKSKKFAVSILSENIDPSIIGTFGFKSGKDTDKFEGVEFKTSGSGIPVLTGGVCAYIECNVINSIDCFTHTIIIAEIVNAENLAKQPPMTYAYYHKVIKGKAPKNAPTYVEEAKVEETKVDTKEEVVADVGKYVCNICGYEYPGTHDEFNSLPDSYECPICSALKSAFSLK